MVLELKSCGIELFTDFRKVGRVEEFLVKGSLGV